MKKFLLKNTEPKGFIQRGPLSQQYIYQSAKPIQETVRQHSLITVHQNHNGRDFK